MRNLFIFVFAIAFSRSVFAADSADTLLLTLQNKVDGEIVSLVELYGNSIDSSYSVESKHVLKINGKAITVPEKILLDLDFGRSEYSHDSFTGGIRSFVSGGRCRMGGRSEGSILQVRYLTLSDDGSSRIIKDEMKSVYSENGNCLFSEGFAPNKVDAEKAAAKTMAILKTIMAFATD